MEARSRKDEDENLERRGKYDEGKVCRLKLEDEGLGGLNKK
jgi:hypothetical protein